MSSLTDEAQRAIVAALTQHTAHNYRASTTVVNAINKEIDRLARELTGALAEKLESLTDAERLAFMQGKYTTSKLKALKAEIDGWATALDQAIKSEWGTAALALAGYEAAFISEALNKAVDGLPKVAVSGKTVLSAAKKKPLLGQFVDDMLTSITSEQKDRIYASIRQGIQSGQTNSQIVRALRGTEALKHKDGLMQITKRDAERVVRTARNHVSNTAYEETYKKLGVKYVEWCSTLDGRTSKICSVRDGERWLIDEPHPTPPAHPNCRSVLVPSFDGDIVGNRPFVRSLKVKKRDGSNQFRAIGDMTEKQRKDAGLEVGQAQAKTTYASWFKNQDAEFQKQWLGSTRYQLYKKSDYSLDRFVDPTGREYTIAELKQRDQATFKAIFGN